MSPKVFIEFSKSLHQLEDVQGGHLGGKFQVRRYFAFAMARWKLFASTTFEILPRSTCSPYQQKSYVSKGIQSIFEIFGSARRCWGWAYWWKDSGAQVFYVCNGNVKTLRMENIWNFATFNMYTVLAKILYLQRYSHDFRNLCLSSKMFRLGIWGESFRCAGILFCNGKVKTLRIDNIWNFATLNMYTAPEKIRYLERYSHDFLNLCLSSKMFRVGILVESFRCAGILLLQWQGENFRIDNIWNFATFNLYTVPAKILCLQRYL